MLQARAPSHQPIMTLEEQAQARLHCWYFTIVDLTRFFFILKKTNPVYFDFLLFSFDRKQNYSSQKVAIALFHSWYFANLSI